MHPSNDLIKHHQRMHDATLPHARLTAVRRTRLLTTAWREPLRDIVENRASVVHVCHW